MVLLETTATTAMYSGLIAAIVSGIVSLIGYAITACIQSKNAKKTIETQKEIAQMQKDEKLFYESQLDWANETRKLIAKFVRTGTELNHVINDYNQVAKLKKSKDPATRIKQETHKAELEAKMEQVISNLQEQVTLLRLYLFHKENKDEQAVLKVILDIEHDMVENNKISTAGLDNLVNVTRTFLDNLMKRLEKESTKEQGKSK